MVIEYNLLSKVSGEISEAEVGESLGELVEQMEADDFNLNRAETRCGARSFAEITPMRGEIWNGY